MFTNLKIKMLKFSQHKIWRTDHLNQYFWKFPANINFLIIVFTCDLTNSLSQPYCYLERYVVGMVWIYTKVKWEIINKLAFWSQLYRKLSLWNSPLKQRLLFSESMTWFVCRQNPKRIDTGITKTITNSFSLSPNN